MRWRFYMVLAFTLLLSAGGYGQPCTALNHDFAADSVAGFEFDGLYWQDVQEPDTFSVLVLSGMESPLQEYHLRSRFPKIDCVASLGGASALGDSTPVLSLVGGSYYVDFPRLRWIVVDVEGMWRLSSYTRLLVWLRAAMERNDDRYTVVMMHRDSHRSWAEYVHELLRWVLSRIIYCNADVVFEKSLLGDYQLLECYGIVPSDTLRMRAYLLNNDSLITETVR